MIDNELGVLLYHAAPLTKYDDTAPSRTEGGDTLVDIATETEIDALLIGADWNHDKATIRRIEAATEGKLHGSALDGIVAAGLDVLSADYVRGVDGVRLGTDHPKGALRIVVRRKGRRLARKRVVWLYNIRVGRDGRQVARELRAMLGQRRTFLVLLTEAAGYAIPQVASHRLVRDRSKPERANLALYVRRGHYVADRWVDLEQTWRRTEHDGQHDPRAILAAVVTWDRGEDR